ncbi:MAG: hypothetical protein SCH71_15300 [Desulfobulbaceae bacterium]|nr:hypothetical protein [Desulfobulbaceae bacterium]
MKKMFMIMALIALIAGPGMVFAEGDPDPACNGARCENDPGDGIPTPNDYDGPPDGVPIGKLGPHEDPGGGPPADILCEALPFLPFCE